MNYEGRLKKSLSNNGGLNNGNSDSVEELILLRFPEERERFAQKVICINRAYSSVSEVTGYLTIYTKRSTHIGITKWTGPFVSLIDLNKIT